MLDAVGAGLGSDADAVRAGAAGAWLLGAAVSD